MGADQLFGLIGVAAFAEQLNGKLAERHSALSGPIAVIGLDMRIVKAQPLLIKAAGVHVCPRQTLIAAAHELRCDEAIPAQLFTDQSCAAVPWIVAVGTQKVVSGSLFQGENRASRMH